MTWVLFLLSIGVIAFAGYHLCRTADLIGDSLGLSQNWVGAVVLATITSMPELISAITSVAKLNLPELAVGNTLGGNVFNLMFFVAMDLIYRKRPLYSLSNHGHLLTAALGLTMMGFVLALFLLQRHGVVPTLGHMGLGSIVLPLIYGLSMKTLFQFEARMGGHPGEIADLPRGKPASKMTYFVFLVAAGAVIAAGVGLPHVGERIVAEQGLNQAFVGTVFMAIATSSPEIAVSVSSIRLGAINLALSNLLASNIFNIVIIGIADLFYAEGPIFRLVSDRNLLTVVSGILMTGLVMIGLVYKPTKRLYSTFTFISFLILMVYVLNNIALYKLEGK